MKKYTLSDGEMIYILGQIDNATNVDSVIYAAVMGTWRAILAQEGTFFTEYVDTHGGLNPTDFGIPADQKLEIAERMKTRLFALNISPIGITNALIDFTVQYGPSHYEPIGAHPSIVDGDDLATVEFPQAEFAHGMQEILPLPATDSDVIELHKPHNN